MKTRFICSIRDAKGHLEGTATANSPEELEALRTFHQSQGARVFIISARK